MPEHKRMTNSLRKKVGQRLREIRRLRGLTQEDMAANASFSRHTYLYMEKGEGEITIDRLYELAAKHELSILHILPDGEEQARKFLQSPLVTAHYQTRGES